MHMRFWILASGLLLPPAPAAPAADFNVVNSGFSDYVINGAADPTLTLERGRTYSFAVAAPGHPFWIKTSRVTGTGSAYNTGVTGNGVQSGTLTFAVPLNAPSSLSYICQFHAAMAGTLNIVDPPPPQPAILTNLLRLPNGNLQFTVLGTPGRPHRILALGDLALSNWVNLATTTPSGASFTFVVTNPGALPRRYYRVTQ